MRCGRLYLSLHGIKTKIKQDRISGKTAVKSIGKEGLGIPNVRNYTNVLKPLSKRKLKTSSHTCKSIIKSFYPKVLLLEQFRSSLSVEVHYANTFWVRVFQVYREFGRKVQLEKPEELAAEPLICNDNIQVGNRTVFCQKMFDSFVCYIGNILNEDCTFMTLIRFKGKYELTQIIITYTGCVQAGKNYKRKIGLIVEENGLTELTKTLQVIYSH